MLVLQQISLKVSVIFNVVIRRNPKIQFKRFTDFFEGFDKVEAVRELFGEKTVKVLKDLKIEFFSRRGYMGVSNDDGHLMISAEYLRKGDERDIYLDIIHELVHVKQHQNGFELHDQRFGYCDRPTELEAFGHAVKEARRIGMTEAEIYEYLRTDWMTDEDVQKLATSLNVKL